MKALLLVLLVVGCVHAKAGDTCALGQAYCDGPTQSLACRDGKLQLFPCLGPKGCAVDKARNVTCDQSTGAVVGDLCFPEYEGSAQCLAGGKSFVFCKDGHWREFACSSGALCTPDPAGIRCK